MLERSRWLTKAKVSLLDQCCLKLLGRSAPDSSDCITCKAGAPLAASPAFDCYALVSHYFLISLRSVITWWAIFHSPPCFSRTRFSDTRRLPVPTDEPLSLSI